LQAELLIEITVLLFTGNMPPTYYFYNSHVFIYLFLIFVFQPSCRKQSVLEALSNFWGDWVQDPIDYVEKNWGEETYVGGCPTHGISPGVMFWFHHIRTPFGRYRVSRYSSYRILWETYTMTVFQTGYL
jgi:hypothetical protein